MASLLEYTGVEETQLSVSRIVGYRGDTYAQKTCALKWGMESLSKEVLESLREADHLLMPDDTKGHAILSVFFQAVGVELRGIRMTSEMWTIVADRLNQSIQNGRLFISGSGSVVLKLTELRSIAQKLDVVRDAIFCEKWWNAFAVTNWHVL